MVSFCPVRCLPSCRRVLNSVRGSFVRISRLGRFCCVCALATTAFGVHTNSAFGADYSISAYGTVGYSRSDQAFTYDQFIDNRGTFRHDTVAGVQLDSRLSNSFGATAQVVGQPASEGDRRYRAAVAWAFLSWRPSGDWLFRLGKQRIPLYLYSQTYNVGVTYDFVRPPIEMYSISPNNDYVGVSFGKTWNMDADEVSLEGNWGNTSIDSRVWTRDDIPGVQTAAASYRHLVAKGVAISLSYKRDDSTYRTGIYRSALVGRNGETIGVTFPFVTLMPGVGYYQLSSLLPGPGVPQIRQIDYSVLSLGADINVGSGFRVVGEFARSVSNKTDFNETANRGYMSLLKQFDRWTPYVFASAVKSAQGPLDLNRAVNSNTVPAFVPGAAFINASQRAAADQIRVQDQHSLAIGASYQITVTQKLKAELMRVRIGRVSSLVDSRSGMDVNSKSINVASMSYSFAF